MSNILVFLRGKNECTYNLPKSFRLVDGILLTELVQLSRLSELPF